MTTQAPAERRSAFPVGPAGSPAASASGFPAAPAAQPGTVRPPYANPYTSTPPTGTGSANPAGPQGPSLAGPQSPWAPAPSRPETGGTPGWPAAGPPSAGTQFGPQPGQPGPSAPFGGRPPMAERGLAAPRGPAPANPPGGPPPGATAPPTAFGLDGFCPVTLIDQESWVRGDQRWGAIHRDRTYLFTSQEHQQRFLAEPDRYAPVLSGFDAVRFVEQGQLVDGKRQHGVFYHRMVFLFADEGALERFWQSPDSYARAVLEAMRMADARGR